MIIYAVTDEESRVRTLFSTRKLARDHIKKGKAAEEFWASGAYVVEWCVDEEKDHEVFDVWQVGVMLDDGSAVEFSTERAILAKKFKSKIVQYGDKIPAYKQRPIVRVQSSVSCTHALEIAKSKREEWLKKETA